MHIKVRVQVGAKNDRVRKITGTTYEISVREKPAQNAANERVIALLARELGLPATHLRIASGHHRPSKLISIII